MEKENSLVSIIVRTKDRPKLLKRALQSIAEQTYRPIEVVLVNDGGCDLEVEELKEILADVTLNYVRLEKNTGRAHAGNVGIEHARGEYIGFLDDDDEFYPEHISSLVSFLEISDNYGGIYTDSEILSREYDDEGNIVKEHKKETFKSYDFSYEVLLFENFIPLICILLKKESLTEVGGFDESFEMFEDWDLFIRISEKRPFYHVRKMTAKYIQWSKFHQIAFIDSLHAADYYLKVLTKHADKITPEVVYRYFLVKQEEVRNAESLLKTARLAIQELSPKNVNIEYYLEQIKSLREEIQTLKVELSDKMIEIQSLRQDLKHWITTQQKEIQSLKHELNQKNAYIDEIQSSAGWMFLQYYRKHIKNRIAPQGSKRWKIYHNFLKVLTTLKREGLRPFPQEVRRITREAKASSSIKQEVFVLPEMRGFSVEKIDANVSVVIPTKNAGAGFHHVLAKIQSQKGITADDIIIVDSGSVDDTLGLAKRHNAKILPIRPSDFGHGRSRNYGAEYAKGDYVVFMSQDAIPVGETCFLDIIGGMRNDGRIAAVSTRQLPRTDADLYACWEIWNHYRNFLGCSEDRVVGVDKKKFESLEPYEKRKVAQLDNVFSCIRKDIFDQFKFNDLPYAEDLDLGLRLIRNGYKIGFLSSVGVIHSHNRNVDYYFKRSYVDRKTLISLLGIEPTGWHGLGINSLSDMLHYVSSTHSKIYYALDRLHENGERGMPAFELADSMMSLIALCPAVMVNPADDGKLNPIINELIAGNSVRLEYGSSIIPTENDVLLRHYYSTLEGFIGYLSCYETIEYRYEEILAAFYKLAAVVLGSNIGDFLAYYTLLNGGERTERIDAIMGKSI